MERNTTDKTVMMARDLSVGYHLGKGKKKVVHRNLSFDLVQGELTCLLGPNGAGKSTLLRTLSASQPSLGGELLFDGTPLETINERQRSKLIGVVLTDKTQTGGLTVYELVALGRQPHTGFFGRLNAHDREVIAEAIEAVGIAHKMKNYMAELSDGERQKAMIAKALVQECPVIILDEPTAFLDVVSRIEIMTLLHEIAVKQKRTILLSTHDIEQALVMADRLWLLSRAKGLKAGVTEDLILNGSMDQLFDRDDILFDNNHGSYYPRVVWKKQMVVEASDTILLHWSINALNRHGYVCFDANDPRAKGCRKLHVRTANDLFFRDEDGIINRFSSFEAMLKDL